MRQIKFRAIVKDNEEKLHLSKPYILDLEEGIPHQDDILDNMEKECQCNCANESTLTCDCPSEFDEGSVYGWIEFTGLKDKNGKEIYEGDIVRCLLGNFETRGKIFFKDSAFMLEVETTILANKNTIFPLITNDYNLEVIGNIYENKGLLK